MSQRNPTDIEINAYAERYILPGGNESESFRAAFPGSKASKETVNAQASKFHKLHKVCIRISELIAVSKKSSEEEFGMTVTQLKKILAKVIKTGLDSGNLSAVIGSVKEFNLMDGNHAPTKTEDITPRKKRKFSKLTAKILAKVVIEEDED